MNIDPVTVTAAIRHRRAIYPAAYNNQPIEKAIIEEILENAHWAPNHKRTEPWRFKVFTGVALERLGAFLAEDYKNNTPEEKYSAMKHKKKAKKPVQSGAVIAICMKRDPEERLPEWEELAAVASAVQNMWLTASAYGIGAYWSSPSTITRMGGFLQLEEGEKCIGLFYMGYTDQEWPEGRRNESIESKVKWISE